MLDSKISSPEQALATLGVTENTLTVDEKKQLDRDGYLMLPGVLSAAEVAELGALVDELSEKEKAEGAQREKGTRHIGQVLYKHPAFAKLGFYPKLLAAGWYILQRDFTVGAHAREPLQGFGQQGLHADAASRNHNDPFIGVTAIWLLDNFTPENGATRYVPGSHLWVGKMLRSVGDPLRNHPQQQQAVMPAGSLFLFNSHLWHSGMVNQSKQRRRSVIALCYARSSYGQPAPEGEASETNPATPPPAWLSAAQAWFVTSKF